MIKHKSVEISDSNVDEFNDEQNNSELESDNDKCVIETDNTFCNPSQSDEGETDNGQVIQIHDKESETDESLKETFKCDYCAFDAPTMRRLKKHMCEIHSVKGKYVCFGCKEEFDTRTIFNIHNSKYPGCYPSLNQQT